MIISPSHTLEYKPNDIIITSSIGDTLLHHPKYLNVILTSLVPWLHLQRFGRWSLGTNLDPGGYLPRRRHVMPSTSRLDFHHVTVSRSWRRRGAALASARIASLSVALRDRPGHAESREEGSPEIKNQRMPDSASLRSFAEQRYLARCVAPRDLGS